MNTNVYIDNELITQAIDLSEFKTKKEIINLALKEYVERRKKKNLAELKGKIEFADGYDYKDLRCGE
ncbi:MAG: type II toxin-antitoxin system VapB family antitoxin [Oscillospiraceae bacterium]|nr:type II toxin-antitoxin system VapB family antitoxin [Oscillospiraceae bacterium]